MKFNFIAPEDQLLKEILVGFYITEFEKPLNYVVFPNNNVIVSSSIGAAIAYDGNTVHIQPSEEPKVVSDIICTYKHPLTFKSKGKHKEISFVFSPLGFNKLIDKSLFDLGVGINKFSPFVLFDDYDKLIEKVTSLSNLTSIKKEIEQYWLSKHIGFKNETLNKIVAEIVANPNVEINALAEKHSISRQYLNRLFKRHLCKSPSEFKKTQRFRNALKKHAEPEMLKKSLTNLTYDSNYYDQSHLIKDFDFFSKMAPSDFFKKNNDFENGLINWVYM